MVTSAEELYYRRYLNDIIPGGGPQVVPIAYQPVTSFSDTFTRANGDIGDNWISQFRRSDISPGDGWARAVINANLLLIQNVGNINATLNNGIWIPRQLISTNPNTGLQGGIWGVDQYAQITWKTQGTVTTARVGIAIFSKNDMGGSVNEAQGYYLVIKYDGGSFTTLQLVESIGGQNENGNTFNVLGTLVSAPVDGDIFRIEGKISGNNKILTCFKNGSQIIQVTDTTPLPSKGYPSFGLLSSSGSNSYNFINFSCGIL